MNVVRVHLELFKAIKIGELYESSLRISSNSWQRKIDLI